MRRPRWRQRRYRAAGNATVYLVTAARKLLAPRRLWRSRRTVCVADRVRVLLTLDVPLMIVWAMRYREDKATQAAARLLSREGGRMNHMKLIKLLYLAEREAIVRYGRPITFDWYYSLPHGPVLSYTLNNINSENGPKEEGYWAAVISERRGHQVGLKDRSCDPPNDQLSPAEEALLDEIFEKYGHQNQWQLRDFSHTLPEWQDPKGSSLPIHLRDILLAEGFTDDDVAEIEEDLRAEEEAARLLGC